MPLVTPRLLQSLLESQTDSAQVEFSCCSLAASKVFLTRPALNLGKTMAKRVQNASYLSLRNGNQGSAL